MPRHFRVHPAIGTARMGSSEEHFIGPETPGVVANTNPDGSFKRFRDGVDGTGKVLRQGARFRVFEYDEGPNGVLTNPREVLVGDTIADIEWRVHLVNRKAQFFVFDGQNGAEDNYVKRSGIPATQQIKIGPPSRPNLRNPDIPTADREAQLVIDPEEQIVSKNGPNSVELTNRKGHIPISSLGTLIREDSGRLVVLGGYGQSAQWNVTKPLPIDEYASNDSWFDDSSDGPVKARVKLSDGTQVDADPAWVFVGPPKFAPGIGNVVSLFDTLWDTAVREVVAPVSTPSTPMLQQLLEQKRIWAASGNKSLTGFRPSFVRDIYPLLKRAIGARDVHVSSNGTDNYHHQLINWKLLSSLAGPEATDAADLRDYIFNLMRDPDSPDVEWEKMPRGLGDNYTPLDDDVTKATPNSFLSLTRIQYAILREWNAGNFDDDWPGAEPVFIENPNPTPDELDRAALENSIGGPFFPGIEVSWLIRVPNLYAEPFRFKAPRAPIDEVTAAPLKIGALDFGPGFFSQQMALPWQADFYDCHKQPFESPDNNKELVFMWWTAQRPDDVFPFGKDKQERWVREFDKLATTDDPDDLQNFNRFDQMQKNWDKLKFIIKKRPDGRFQEEP